MANITIINANLVIVWELPLYQPVFTDDFAIVSSAQSEVVFDIVVAWDFIDKLASTEAIVLELAIVRLASIIAEWLASATEQAFIAELAFTAELASVAIKLQTSTVSMMSSTMADPYSDTIANQ